MEEGRFEEVEEGPPRSWICINVANWVCRKISSMVFQRQLRTLLQIPDLEIICGFDQGVPDEENPYLDFVFIRNCPQFPFYELEGQEDTLGIINTDSRVIIEEADFEAILDSLKENSKLGLGGFVEIKKRPFLGVIGRVLYMEKSKAWVALNLGGLEHHCLIESRDLQVLEGSEVSRDSEERSIQWSSSKNGNPFYLLEVVLPEPKPKLVIHRRGKRNTRVVIGAKTYLVPSNQIPILKLQFEETSFDDPELNRVDVQSPDLSGDFPTNSSASESPGSCS